jgi:hypothetical protein
MIGVGVDSVLAAVGAALGTSLSDPVDLGGSARTTVHRCRTAAGDHVIVKAYRDDPEALACFTAEAAGLAFTRHGPTLLAADVAAPWVVMSDLGTAPSLADVLLGHSAAAAEHGLVDWARGYGRIAAETIGRQDELSALRRRYDRGQPDWDGADWINKRIAGLPDVLDTLGVTGPAGLAGELADVATLAAGSPYPVFSPGDICPDNNLITPDGLRVLDFEGAGYHPVFLDAAYTTMPFSTCWCVFRLPARMTAEIEAAYRTEVVTGYPELADDEVWRPGLLRALAAWTLDITVELTTTALIEDRPVNTRHHPVPTLRQLLRYRWERLSREAAQEPDGLPALAALARKLLAATTNWNVEPLPGYPAFTTE